MSHKWSSKMWEWEWYRRRVAVTLNWSLVSILAKVALSSQGLSFLPPFPYSILWKFQDVFIVTPPLTDTCISAGVQEGSRCSTSVLCKQGSVQWSSVRCIPCVCGTHARLLASEALQGFVPWCQRRPPRGGWQLYKVSANCGVLHLLPHHTGAPFSRSLHLFTQGEFVFHILFSCIPSAAQGSAALVSAIMENLLKYRISSPASGLWNVSSWESVLLTSVPLDFYAY